LWHRLLLLPSPFRVRRAALCLHPGAPFHFRLGKESSVVKRMSWSATFAVSLAATVLLACLLPASLAQQGRPDPRNEGRAPGACYICGTLDYVWVDGADWFGTLAEDACRKHLGGNRASPEARQSYCNQIKSKVGQVCPQAAGTCDSPNGKYCGDNVPGKGSLYAGTLDNRIYSEPSTNSTVVGSPPAGTRLLYTNTAQVNGQTWYYIDSPGKERKGWMPGSRLSCTRPVAPPPPKRVLDIDSSLEAPGTTVQIAGARG